MELKVEKPKQVEPKTNIVQDGENEKELTKEEKELIKI